MTFPKLYNRTIQHLLDLLLLAGAFLLAHILRFEGIPEDQHFKHMLFQLPYVVIMTLGVYYLTGVYRYVWRYVSLTEIKGFVFAHAIVGTILTVTRLLGLPGKYQYAIVPLSIIAINGILAFLGSVGLRVLYRLIVERSDRIQREHSSGKTDKRRVFLIGAGSAGLLAARELKERTDLGLKPVGFIDDNPAKQGQEIQGIKVLGSIDRLQNLVETYKIDMLLITIASLTGSQMRRIKDFCDKTNLPTKIVPGIYELIDGKVSITRLRAVEIQDLLGREVVHLDEESIGRFLQGKIVLITGAGGSIGSEMCRQVCKYMPSMLLLVEQAESPLFDIHRELVAKKYPFDLLPLVGDICDSLRMQQIFSSYKPQVVIHAAAHKHVPMMEWNPGEAIKNNVLGTKKLADEAVRVSVERFIMISTDKAVRPTSVMGATKRLAEMYLQSITHDSHETKFIAVRFGNVLGSVGSVIPIFKEQIRQGGPITITHPEMQRYFMTIPEASQLVLQAAAMGRGGEVFVLDMGEPVKIVDLAHDLIRLSGLHDDEIEIVFTGMRPGEKLFEEICLSCEHFSKTGHEKIFIGKLASVDKKKFDTIIEELHKTTDGHDKQTIVSLIKSIVPDYAPKDARLGD